MSFVKFKTKNNFMNIMYYINFCNFLKGLPLFICKYVISTKSFNCC